MFDGSCDLIPIKVISSECKVLSEDFIVQLVETLSSEMDPQVVCATAGWYNHASYSHIYIKKDGLKKSNRLRRIL